MLYLLEGIQAGLLLALLVGPLVVMLLQLSIRRGTLYAFVAAGGIWVSDLLLVVATHYGIGGLDELSRDPVFQGTVGGIGVAILIGTAVFMWFRDPPDLDAPRTTPDRKGLVAAFLQGFAVNTFNPFTIGFWVLFSLTQIHDRGLSQGAAWAVYAGLLGTIVLSDTIKVLAARRLRKLLRPEVLLRVQRVGAVVLGGFGLVLGARVAGWV